MKASKLISLDTELIIKLKKESNASEIINNLLLKFYNIRDSLSVEELQRELKELELIEVSTKSKLLKLKQMMNIAEIKEKNDLKTCIKCKKTIKKGENHEVFCNTRGKITHFTHKICPNTT